MNFFGRIEPIVIFVLGECHGKFLHLEDTQNKAECLNLCKTTKGDVRNRWGLFTWRNQDDQMNMTEIGEHDQKIDNDER